MQYFDINIAPGAVREINVQGSFVYFLSGSAGGADTTIELRAVSGSDTVLMKPGQAFRLGSSINQRWVVANHAGQGTIIGTLLMGDGDFSDNRISGSVEVVDGGKFRTLANQAFAGAAGYTAAAGQLVEVQLWNQANSGKNIFVEQCILSAANAGEMSLKFSQTQLAVARGAPSSKKAGGAAGVGLFYVASSAEATAGDLLADGYLVANQSFPYKWAEPVMLPPGWGMHVTFNTPAASLVMSLETYEEAI